MIATTQAGIATTQATNSSNSATAAAASAATAAAISASGLDVVVNGSVVEVDNSGGLTSGSKTGTAPQDIVRHQFLSGMAYQDPNNVTIGGGSATLTSLTATTVTGTSMVYNGTELNSRLNPLAQAVSVQMTAASASPIQQLDNANLNFALGDLTIHAVCAFADWTALNRIFYKDNFGVDYKGIIVYTESSRIKVSFGNASNTAATVFQSAAFSITANTVKAVTVSITRETASVAGAINIYFEGVLYESIAIPAVQLQPITLPRRAAQTPSRTS